MMKKENSILILILVLIVSVISCGRNDSNINKSSRSSKSSRIENASIEQIEEITSSIEHGATVSNFKTIKSNDFNNVYFVSATLTDYSGYKTTAIWATGGKTDISMILSANVAADQFSPWPYGPDTESGISYMDDGGRILLKSY